jgi:hypothetical protein
VKVYNATFFEDESLQRWLTICLTNAAHLRVNHSYQPVLVPPPVPQRSAFWVPEEVYVRTGLAPGRSDVWRDRTAGRRESYLFLHLPRKEDLGIFPTLELALADTPQTKFPESVHRALALWIFEPVRYALGAGVKTDNSTLYQDFINFCSTLNMLEYNAEPVAKVTRDYVAQKERVRRRSITIEQHESTIRKNEESLALHKGRKAKAEDLQAKAKEKLKKLEVAYRNRDQVKVKNTKTSNPVRSVREIAGRIAALNNLTEEV